MAGDLEPATLQGDQQHERRHERVVDAGYSRVNIMATFVDSFLCISFWLSSFKWLGASPSFGPFEMAAGRAGDSAGRGVCEVFSVSLYLINYDSRLMRFYCLLQAPVTSYDAGRYWISIYKFKNGWRGRHGTGWCPGHRLNSIKPNWSRLT